MTPEQARGERSDRCSRMKACELIAQVSVLARGFLRLRHELNAWATSLKSSRRRWALSAKIKTNANYSSVCGSSAATIRVGSRPKEKPSKGFAQSCSRRRMGQRWYRSGGVAWARPGWSTMFRGKQTGRC